MCSDNNYVYQISTNPMVNSKDLRLPFNDKEDNFSFCFVGEFAVETGMFNSLEETVEAIRNSSLVYMIHGLDATSYFELGIAISLGKLIYYVTKEDHEIFDFQLPYDIQNLIPIRYDEFMCLLDSL